MSNNQQNNTPAFSESEMEAMIYSRKKLTIEQRKALRLYLLDWINSGKPNMSEVVITMRRVLAMSQTEYAKKHGIGLNTLKRLESGEGNITLEVLNKLGATFAFETAFRSKR